MRTELKNIPTADDLTSFDFFIGTRNNNDGTYTDKKFTYAQIAALAAGSQTEIITVTSDSNTLTDIFFATHTISLIITNGQTYAAGLNFTQSGDTITGIDIQFYENQALQART